MYCAQVQHHLSNLDHSSVAAVDAYTASVDLCYCHMHALGQPRMKLLFGFIWERSSRFGEGRQFLCYCFSSFSKVFSLIALLLLEYHLLGPCGLRIQRTQACASAGAATAVQQL
jgi:hypothetical protein